MPLITLTTDFGLRDAYVGIMKGVILSINPRAKVVDLTHQVAAQDLLGAAFEVGSSYRCFPAGTLHVVVVDPGVGGLRKIIAMTVNGHIFLAPDNGIAGYLARMGACTEMVRVENRDLFLKPVSATFHGRDIFAPVAAHLSMEYPMRGLGTSMDPSELRPPQCSLPVAENGRMVGTIVKVDRFGNLISNIDSRMVADLAPTRGKMDLMTRVLGHTILGLSRTYEDASPGGLLTLIGSGGYLEIAANCENAGRLINARRGERIEIQWITRGTDQ